MNVKLDTKTGTLILAAVAILIIVFIAAFVFKAGQGGPSTGRPAAAGPTPAYAPQGQVVVGFPKELILDAQARISNSYAINYSAALNQYTVEWNSSSSMQTLYAAYKKYFTDNRWTITNDFTTRPTTRAVAAKSGTNTASVVILAQEKGSRVIISYIQKQAK